ncbi:MAG: carotenoid 1,2-hydratase, partial [Terrimicrobiaceae bacterium]|nr:carotenoid 1,2-hydratase [Terrimicrobiaceae bacterium]
MKKHLLLAGLLTAAAPPQGLAESQAGWAQSLPGWNYEFPRDHGPHPEFKTEWWYFTGNLRAGDGREFGFQLTFFRQGVAEPGRELPASSRFLVRDVGFAHFALSDFRASRFHHAQRLTRGAFGESTFSSGEVRIEDWVSRRTGLHDFAIEAEDGGRAIRLTLEALKPPVAHGDNGVSQKAEGPGRASHYYSLSRLRATGSVKTQEGEFPVEGLAWFDHEWFTNQLAAGQVGWEW